MKSIPNPSLLTTLYRIISKYRLESGFIFLVCLIAASLQSMGITFLISLDYLKISATPKKNFLSIASHLVILDNSKEEWIDSDLSNAIFFVIQVYLVLVFAVTLYVIAIETWFKEIK
jgi:hypothetical protein